jgi:type IV secretion system protein TrbG
MRPRLEWIIFFLLARLSVNGQESTPSPAPTAAQAPTSVAEATLAPSPAAAPASTFDPALLGGRNPVLTDEERAGVAITDAWRDRSITTMTSQAGVSGSVQFRYGESYPSIVCAILQVTDIELQPGETVTHINVGDSTRWSVESAVSGNGSDQVFHLLIKPRDIGLSTSLVVTTDRRTYHLLLVSDQAEFMHSVSFVYRDEPQTTAPITAAAAQSAPDPAPTPAAPVRTRKSGDGKRIQIAATEPDDADESYTVSGKADWKTRAGIFQGRQNVPRDAELNAPQRGARAV